MPYLSFFDPQECISVPGGKRQHVRTESSEESLPNVVMFVMLWAELSGKTGHKAAPRTAEETSFSTSGLGAETENSEESCVGKVS